MSEPLDLGPGGRLARLLPGYEDRPGQRAMAEAVAVALHDSEILLCEAGTGTGKTLAYLLPALLSGQRVVVSTATKALMDQVLEKDLPLIWSSWPDDIPRPRVALAKGLRNYVCRRRYAELRSDPAALRRHSRALPLVEAFVQQHTSGDISRADLLSEDDPIWSEITSSPETRLGAKCSYFEDCFVTKMRQELEEAQLLVTNHHLFFADLALRTSLREVAPRAGVLPSYDAVVFDEAHRVEDVAGEFFGYKLSTAQLAQLASQAERAFAQEGDSDPVFSRGDGAVLCRQVISAGRVLFDELARHCGATEGRTELDADLRLLLLRGDALANLDAALEALASYAEAQATADATWLVARRASETRQEATRVLSPGSLEVAWYERRERTEIIGASNVSVAEKLREVLFERTGAIVLTSATLASVPLAARKPKAPDPEHTQHDWEDPPASQPKVVAGPFSFVRQRLGIEDLSLATVRELTVPSPFDFEARCLLYVAGDLAEPTSAEFAQQAAARAAELAELTEGGVFVLTTSRRGLLEMATQLRKRLPHQVLVQGERPKSALIDTFRRDGNAVLVGTQTFWEGVDVPGPSLRLVIVDKLPFPVPTDALVAARSAALQARGYEPFVNYAIPAATILLKQGLGRLIRTRKDFGIAAVLDRRLVSRGYGKKILRELPMQNPIVELAELGERYRALLTQVS